MVRHRRLPQLLFPRNGSSPKHNQYCSAPVRTSQNQERINERNEINVISGLAARTSVNLVLGAYVVGLLALVSNLFTQFRPTGRRKTTRSGGGRQGGTIGWDSERRHILPPSLVCLSGCQRVYLLTILRLDALFTACTRIESDVRAEAFRRTSVRPHYKHGKLTGASDRVALD